MRKARECQTDQQFTTVTSSISPKVFEADVSILTTSKGFGLRIWRVTLEPNFVLCFLLLLIFPLGGSKTMLFLCEMFQRSCNENGLITCVQNGQEID